MGKEKGERRKEKGESHAGRTDYGYNLRTSEHQNIRTSERQNFRTSERQNIQNIKTSVSSKLPSFPY